MSARDPLPVHPLVAGELSPAPRARGARKSAPLKGLAKQAKAPVKGAAKPGKSAGKAIAAPGAPLIELPAKLPVAAPASAASAVPGAEVPARRGRPPANVADRRAAIVAAARAVFARHGLESASMRLIAQEAGVAAPTLYLYFAGAEELYGAALSASLADLGAALRVAGAQARGKRERATALAHAFFDFYYARPDDAALGLYLNRGLGPRGLTAELDAQLNAELLAALKPITSALRELQSLSPRAADTAAFALASSAMGVAIFHHARRDKSLRVDARAAFEQLLSWVLRP